MLKAIIDTNIWISALMKSSLTRPVLEAFIQKKFIPVISNELLKELNDVLNEAEVRRLIDPDEAKELISLIDEKSQKLKTTIKVKACRDPEDDFLLSLIKEAKAPLVSLDKDLLILSREFNIIPPKEFLKRLSKE